MGKLIISLFFLIQTSIAQSNDLSMTDSMMMASRNAFAGSEYISGSKPGVVLMKVNLWGAVIKPGIHHIPAKTDLISLFSYAGGPLSSAELDSVLIKRVAAGGTEKKISVNVDEILHGSSMQNLMLEPNDIIVVPAHKPVISSDTSLLVSIIATLATLSLTTYILIDRAQGNR